MNRKIRSKLPNVGTTIFTVMSALANKHNAINLSQGFPNYDCPQGLKDLVCKAIQDGKNQYAPMGGLPVLNEQIAAKTALLYGRKVDPKDEITVTAGATQAIYTAIETFVHEGDEVILVEPAYDCYSPAVEMCKGVVVSYQIEAPTFQIDWDAFAQLVSPKTRMIILNTPHNPTGSVLQSSDWKALAKIVEGTDIIVMSDEVYEHITYDEYVHQSILRFPELWQRTIAISSFGKTFHNTGWKMGYCVAPKKLMGEFRKVHQFTVFCVNAPIQHALAEYLKEPNNYLEIPSFYQSKKDLFNQIIRQTRFEPIDCKGTYFQVCKYDAISDESDVDFAKRMTKEFGVAVIPVSVFYSQSPKEQVVRFCFAKTAETLIEAGERLALI